MNEWISILEELPELKRRVLVYDSLGFGVLTARRGSAGWYLEGELDHYANVTHWMPLPEPPATDSNDGNVKLKTGV